MTDDLAAAFAGSCRGIVVAAAGCGKTELIAQAVAKYANGRQLVLTHTHAGVRALRDRLRRLGADPGTFRVDTIAGFALRYASAFPRISNCQVTRPKTEEDYLQVYDACARALSNRHVRDTVCNTYTGTYIDEYQDCTIRHHAIVKALADFLPCRAVGDPMQGIFDFADDPLADWNQDVLGYFVCLGELTTPFRWTKTNPALGEWLGGVRDKLVSGCSIDLDGYWKQLPDTRTRIAAQVAECKRALSLKDGAVVVIRKWDKQMFAIGKMLKGTFACMEEVECRALAIVCGRLDEAIPGQRPAILLDFARQCMTSVPAAFKTLENCLIAGKAPSPKFLAAYPGLCRSLAYSASTETPAAIISVLSEIAMLRDVSFHRKELYFELRNVGINFDPDLDESLQATAWRIRESTRRAGRRLPRLLISRTVLIKGLEFEHALIPDADDFDNAKDFYVAVTRASKTLCVLSNKRYISRAKPNAANFYDV
ncbi:MAG: AAA family ATPase [Candidatus Aminicenantales bacterium]